MLQIFKNGQGSIILRAKLLDSSSTTGAGLTGLLFSSTGLIISTIADNEATATAYTAAGSTTETITTLGTYAAPTATKCRFKEVDATNHKGLYEFQFADARFAVASAKSMIVSVLGATNLQQADFLIQLQSLDPYVATQPVNVTQLLGTAWLTPGVAGTPDVNAKQFGGAPVTATTSVTIPAASTLATTAGAVGSVTAGVTVSTNNDKTGYSLAATGLDAITQAATGMVEIAKAVWDRVLTAATHNIATSAGRRLRQVTALTQTDASVNDAAATTTSFKTTLTEVDDFWNDALIIFTSGALLGQSRPITTYTNLNGAITLDEPLTSAPANGVTFTIDSAHVHSRTQMASTLWRDTTAGDFTVAGSIGKSIMNGVTLGTGLTVAITSNIKKNQALSAFEFLMTDSTNHAPATLKTVSVTRSIDGGAFAAGTLSAVTEVSNGVYRVDFGAGDLNGNVVLLRATATGCDDTFERIVTQP